MAVMGFITQVVVSVVIISISKSTTPFRCSKHLEYLTYWLKSEHSNMIIAYPIPNEHKY